MRIQCLTKNSAHAHMPISLQSGARGLKKLSCLKYYNELKRENRLTLGINTAKIPIV